MSSVESLKLCSSSASLRFRESFSTSIVSVVRDKSFIGWGFLVLLSSSLSLISSLPVDSSNSSTVWCSECSCTSMTNDSAHAFTSSYSWFCLGIGVEELKTGGSSFRVDGEISPSSDIAKDAPSTLDNGDTSSFGLVIGFQGRLFTGVAGDAGRSTIKSLWKGHGVFSNCSTFPRTSLSSSICNFSILLVFGTSILQYWGGLICSTNFPDSSTTQHCDFGSMGFRALEQLRNATDPGARYIRKGPVIEMLV